MRPRIPDALEKELEKEKNGKPLYLRAGYTSKTAFINQAVREKVEHEKEKLKEENKEEESDKNSITEDKQTWSERNTDHDFSK